MSQIGQREENMCLRTSDIGQMTGHRVQGGPNYTTRYTRTIYQCTVFSRGVSMEN